MAMVKMLVHLPASLKAQLDGLKKQGYTASGYIRALVEREFQKRKPTKKQGG